MATKKATSRKGAVRKTGRAATKKKAPKKKASAKRAVSSRKTAAKKAAKKRTSKTVSKKKASKKKPAAKKAAARKTAKKPASKKKPAAKKKSSVKKTAAKKKAAPKKKAAVKKKVSVKKTPAKAASSKKKVSTKAAKPRQLSKKARAAKTAAAKRLATPPVRRVGPDAAPRRRKRSVDSDSLIHGITPYTPAAGEEYMSDEQLDHFREILNAWKQELMEEVDRTVHHMQDEASNFPDPTDRATQESEFGLELRTRDRERKLLKKIDQAIARVDDGSYGFCEETGEEIGLKRLEARPVATLSVEAQERRELAERQFRDRDDQYR